MIIIGISGKIGSGKSTSADFLEKELISKGLRCQQLSFATRLKETIATLCDTSNEVQFTQDGKNTVDPILGKTYGELQQTLGEGLRNLLGWDIWIKLALDPQRDLDVVIIPDCRYKNEAQAIRSRGGLLVRINGDVASIRANSKRNLTHSSEIDLDDWTDWNLVIDNTNFGMNHLEEKLRGVMGMI
jgi:cytidylate kinase